MTPEELFDQLLTQGAMLYDVDGTLYVSPAERAREYADQIRANKTDLIWLVRKKNATGVIASTWPELCCWCEQWQEWKIDHGLYCCQYCGKYFRFYPKERAYMGR